MQPIAGISYRDLAGSRMGGGEGRAAGLLGGRELHELDASLIGVEEVELHFAVAANLGLAAVGAFAVVAGERGDGVLHLGDAEREVIGHAGLAQRWDGRWVEHVLDPVGAVGDLQGNPVGDGVGVAAVPVGAEAEDGQARRRFPRRGHRP